MLIALISMKFQLSIHVNINVYPEAYRDAVVVEASITPRLPPCDSELVVCNPIERVVEVPNPASQSVIKRW